MKRGESMAVPLFVFVFGILLAVSGLTLAVLGGIALCDRLFTDRFVVARMDRLEEVVQLESDLKEEDLEPWIREALADKLKTLRREQRRR